MTTARIAASEAMVATSGLQCVHEREGHAVARKRVIYGDDRDRAAALVGEGHWLLYSEQRIGGCPAPAMPR